MSDEHNPSGRSADSSPDEGAKRSVTTMEDGRRHTRYGIVLRCSDDDTVRCLERDGRVAARGAWYCDAVMNWLGEEKNGRFTFRRTGPMDVEVKRV